MSNLLVILLFCIPFALHLCAADSSILHDKWIVLTTINKPTAVFTALEHQLRCLTCLPEWHIVVVADRKTPPDWHVPGVVFLGIEEQQSLGYHITSLLPWNHYSRKNIGYLYAIEHDAKIIYETDDDNFLYGNIPLLPERTTCLLYDTHTPCVNPYAHFGKPTVWPRGYPLKHICTYTQPQTSLAENLLIPIQQGVVDKDPDVDAIFRLTRNELVYFDQQAPAVALPRGTMTPFNSQNTIFYHSAFWALLMPMSTSFRVADIWRGYFVQRLLWDIGGALCYLPPMAFQERNEHDFLKDFSQEIDLYLHAEKLIHTLLAWQSSNPDFFARVVELYDTMAAHHFIGESDCTLVRAWIADLKALGYSPPPLCV